MQGFLHQLLSGLANGGIYAIGILLYGFAGALLGGIDNPWGTALGGFIVSILENIAGAYVVGTELKLTVALVIIVGVLVQARRPLRSNPGRASVMMATLNKTPVKPAAHAVQWPPMWRYVGITAILAIAGILPFAVSGYRLSQFSQVRGPLASSTSSVSGFGERWLPSGKTRQNPPDNH
jgi:hypothetical protein